MEDKTKSDKKAPFTKVPNPAIRNYFDKDHENAEKYSTDPDPPGRWNLMPEYPATDEILGFEREGITLPFNKNTGKWQSADIYLGTYFNLIREEAVSPLREAVVEVRKNPKTLDTSEFWVYEKVYLTQVVLSDLGLGFRMQFSTKRAGKDVRWDSSPRLTPGSLLALSPIQDSFASKCIVATVAARADEGLNKSPAEIDIFIPDHKDSIIDSQQEWILVEARSGYYESNRHTMVALQKLSKEKFPFSKHVCRLDPDVGVPEYVKENPIMDFRCLTPDADEDTKFNVIEDMPAHLMEGILNSSQQKALHKMLTRQLSIVQGPPGTGKTFLSVITMKLILSQMTNGDPPVIIAAQTNHALDQIVMHISEFEQNYVRMGGRSSNLAIRKHQLNSVKKSQPQVLLSGGSLGPAKKEMKYLQQQIVKFFRSFRDNGEQLIAASVFVEYGLLTKEQLITLPSYNNPWVAWLKNQVFEFHPKEDASNFSSSEKLDSDQEYMKFKKLVAGQTELQQSDRLHGITVDLKKTFSGQGGEPMSDESILRYIKCPDLRRVPHEARGNIYNLLRRQLFEILHAKFGEMAGRYKKLTQALRIGKWEIEHETLVGAKFVALTTTGLSKYRGLIASLKPRVILIEEAAEVTEAPVAAACFESLQQLILVGDHFQLKGVCEVKDLTGKPFYLDMSMFERLVGNMMPFSVLREQRRMAPEIRELVEPIYGRLYDHISVTEYDPVPGMGKARACFFNHRWIETGDDLASKLNEAEAEMVVEFFIYLLKKGVSPIKITIMTPYEAQRKTIWKLCKSRPYTNHLNPNIVTVDSYQGEENDIVLLSLVRNNNNASLGFLSQDNRICVAISRAKRGFFIFGNKNFVQAHSPLWLKVISILANRGHITDKMPPGCKQFNEVPGGRPRFPKIGSSDSSISSDTGDSSDTLSAPPCTFVFRCCHTYCGLTEPHDHECVCWESTKECGGNGTLETIDPEEMQIVTLWSRPASPVSNSVSTEENPKLSPFGYVGTGRHLFIQGGKEKRKKKNKSPTGEQCFTRRGRHTQPKRSTAPGPTQEDHQQHHTRNDPKQAGPKRGRPSRQNSGYHPTCSRGKAWMDFAQGGAQKNDELLKKEALAKFQASKATGPRVLVPLKVVHVESYEKAAAKAWQLDHNSQPIIHLHKSQKSELDRPEKQEAKQQEIKVQDTSPKDNQSQLPFQDDTPEVPNPFDRLSTFHKSMAIAKQPKSKGKLIDDLPEFPNPNPVNTASHIMDLPNEQLFFCASLLPVHNGQDRSPMNLMDDPVLFDGEVGGPSPLLPGTFGGSIPMAVNEGDGLNQVPIDKVDDLKPVTTGVDDLVDLGWVPVILLDL
ncbi:hypothetical protein N7495_001190 [Penicillium taxi]|uniref:uncharacterized protein n=1 Tax=Penicillium taxi TaxID=168475 RepID=UPI002545A077|nr:uncharacterized protein N7495_001190 [Penicillium taxi]KAJ5908508.1 hypothetical protein N7495_001190 [Penicillium taxi]